MAQKRGTIKAASAQASELRPLSAPHKIGKRTPAKVYYKLLSLFNKKFVTLAEDRLISGIGSAVKPAPGIFEGGFVKALFKAQES